MIIDRSLAAVVNNDPMASVGALTGGESDLARVGYDGPGNSPESGEFVTESDESVASA